MSTERLFVGLYSGWSADGIDGALIGVSGRGSKMKVRQLNQAHQPIGEELRNRILDVSADKAMPPPVWAALNQEVSVAFADAALSLIKHSAPGR